MAPALLRAIVLTWASAATVALAAVAQPRPGARGVLLERWVAMVDAHTPGKRDSAVEEVAGLPPADRAPLMEGAAKFVGFLREAGLQDGRPMRSQSNPENERARLLAMNEVKRTSLNAWLHRAAVLHADAVMLANDLTPSAAPPVRTSRPAATPSAELVEAEDGEYQSTGQRNWGLEFGRKLLDGVDPSPRDDEFVGAWYHATAAFLLSKSWLGELQPHLVRAEQARPDDPRITFDLGVLFEGFGMSRVQAVATTARLPPGVRLAVPSLTASENRALGYYRRVLTIAPAFVEARVRLGRVLVERGRFDDALVELRRAIAETRDPFLIYHAHLFAARAEQGLGHDADAVAHCRDAVRVFPGAQSAQIALSLAALRAGDMPGAVAPVEVIRAMPFAFGRDDPWWSYHLGAGRDSDAMLDALWKAVK